MDSNIYKDSIILIGPSGAGKTETAKQLGAKTGLPVWHLDPFANQVRENYNFMRQFNSNDEFNKWLISFTVSSTNEPGICAFGAGHSIFRDKELFQQVKKILQPFENIVLLLPTDDDNYNLEILNSRTLSEDGKLNNSEFLRSTCNKELATITIYTNQKTIPEVSDEIIEQLKERKEVWKK